MASLYGYLKPIYKKVVPARVQRLTWDRRYPFYWVVDPLKRLLQKNATHDEIYDGYYYDETVEGPAAESCRIMASTLCAAFSPRTAIDVGCGTGALLEAFQDNGAQARGFEYSDAAIARAVGRGLQVEKLDLEAVDRIPAEADLVVSMEVAEHLPESCSDRYVRLLTEAGNRVVITAATPGQGGTDHVNEQPNEYWIAKFAALGFGYDKSLSETFRLNWRGRGVASFYSNNVMVFTKD